MWIFNNLLKSGKMNATKSWLFVIICSISGSVQGLTCTCGNVEESQRLDCECKTVHNIKWFFKEENIATCIPTECITNSLPGYNFSHTGSTYSIAISSFSDNNCKKYSCVDQQTQQKAIFPYCPVLKMTKPVNGGTINIAENTSGEFQCEIRSGYPAGTVEWYTDSKTPDNFFDDVNITVRITSTSGTSSTDNEEYITTSTLLYLPSRSDTGNRIYCKATNKPEQTSLISQRKPLINVLYYCDGPIIQEGVSYRVIEKTSGQLTCFVTGGNPQPTIQWNCNGGTERNASNGDRITNTVTWTAQIGDSNSCSCSSTQSGLQSRNASTDVVVLYPPWSPTFTVNGLQTTGNISLQENNSKQIVCKSNGNPDPSIQWQTPAGSSATKNGHILNFSRIRKTDKGSYTCDVSNTMDPTGKATVPGVNSSTTQINVLYAPSMLSFYFDNINGSLISKKTIDVIKDDTFKIACKSKDGEPVPTISWSGQSTNDPILTVHQITESVTWKTCTATNQMRETGGSNTEQGIKSDNITFNILLPPTISGCKFYYNNKPNNVINNPHTLMIKEGQSFTLTCDANGKPPPVPMWTIPSSSSSSASVTVNDVTRDKKGTYTFSASIVMKPTFQPSRTIIANETISVSVLYPPVITKIDDVSQMKGSTLQLDCPYTEGFPAETTITWTRDRDSQKWVNKTLYISQIKKTDAGIYSCNASNTMRPSGESQSHTDGDRKSFVLNVLYEASVTSFYVNGKPKDTVNENSPVSLRCTADGYPTANITLKNSSLSMKSDTSNNLEFTIPKASCLDARTYSCLAFNEYNSLQTALKTVQLFVNCLPRSADSVYENKTSEKNETFTFTFNAIAYPVPVFIWWKQINDNWIQVKNDINILISSSELQSNLTIHRVQQQDFTRYKLVISNTIGTKEQFYQLEPYDEPDPPTHFRQIGDMTTESIQLEWKPGFNGGPPQVFYVSYKKSSSNSWTHISVPDSGEQIMQYSVTGLETDAQYTFFIFASNLKGNSTESEVLIAHTLGHIEKNPGPLIGGVVSAGMASCLIAVAVIVFVLRRNRIRKGNSIKKQTRGMCGTDNPSNEVSYYNIGRDLQKTNENEATYYNQASTPEYEMLNKSSGENTTYSSLQSCIDNDIRSHDSPGENKIYVNLQLQPM